MKITICPPMPARGYDGQGLLTISFERQHLLDQFEELVETSNTKFFCPIGDEREFKKHVAGLKKGRAKQKVYGTQTQNQRVSSMRGGVFAAATKQSGKGKKL